MNTQTIPTEPPEPSRSLFFPDLSPEDFAEAQRLAAALAVPSMPCDADDVLLAMHLISTAKYRLAQGLVSPGLTRLSADNVTAQRANVALARMLRRLHGDADPQSTLLAVRDLVDTFAVVLSVAASDKRRPKHPGG